MRRAIKEILQKYKEIESKLNKTGLTPGNKDVIKNCNRAAKQILKDWRKCLKWK